MKYLKTHFVKEVFKDKKYMAVRLLGGYECGINAAITKLSRYKDIPNKDSAFISYREIGLHEYISIKHPFVTVYKSPTT